MKNYNEYLVTKRFKDKAVCGDLNLPFGTKCFVNGLAICCDKGEICYIASDNAYEYFTQNDDGCAVLRRKLIDSIFNAVSRSKQDVAGYDEKWDKIWQDCTCLKYRREDCGDDWVWNYDFYNASITDLQYIAKLVNAKEVA